MGVSVHSIHYRNSSHCNASNAIVSWCDNFVQPCFSSGTSVPPSFEISLSPPRAPVGAMSSRPAPPPIPLGALASIAPATYDEASLASAVREDGFVPLPTSTSTVDRCKSTREPSSKNATTTLPDGEHEGAATAPPFASPYPLGIEWEHVIRYAVAGRLTCTGENPFGISSDEQIPTRASAKSSSRSFSKSGTSATRACPDCL